MIKDTKIATALRVLDSGDRLIPLVMNSQRSVQLPTIHCAQCAVAAARKKRQFEVDSRYVTRRCTTYQLEHGITGCLYTHLHAVFKYILNHEDSVSVERKNK